MGAMKLEEKTVQIRDDFDPDKVFPEREALPCFEVDNPDGCAIFNDKTGLPNFKIKV